MFDARFYEMVRRLGVELAPYSAGRPYDEEFYAILRRYDFSDYVR